MFLELTDESICHVLERLNTKHFVRVVHTCKSLLKYMDEFQLSPVLKHDPESSWTSEHAHRLKMLTYIRMVHTDPDDFRIPSCPHVQALNMYFCRVRLKSLFGLNLPKLRSLNIHQLMPGITLRLPPRFFAIGCFAGLHRLSVTCHKNFLAVEMALPPQLEYFEVRCECRLKITGKFPDSLKKVRMKCSHVLWVASPFPKTLEILSLTVRRASAPMATLFARASYPKLRALHVTALHSDMEELQKMPNLRTFIHCSTWIHFEDWFALQHLEKVVLHARSSLQLSHSAWRHLVPVAANNDLRITVAGKPYTIQDFCYT